MLTISSRAHNLVLTISSRLVSSRLANQWDEIVSMRRDEIVSWYAYTLALQIAEARFLYVSQGL